MAKSKQEDSAHAVESMREQNKLNVLLSQLQNANEKQQIADRQITQSFTTIARLSAAVKASKFLTDVDTTFVTVSPEYVMYCDSLAMSGEATVIEFAGYKKRTIDLLLAHDTTIKLQGAMLQRERDAYNACRTDFNALQQLYKRAGNQLRPRNQIYTRLYRMSARFYPLKQKPTSSGKYLAGFSKMVGTMPG